MNSKPCGEPSTKTKTRWKAQLAGPRPDTAMSLCATQMNQKTIIIIITIIITIIIITIIIITITIIIHIRSRALGFRLQKFGVEA